MRQSQSQLPSRSLFSPHHIGTHRLDRHHRLAFRTALAPRSHHLSPLLREPACGHSFAVRTARTHCYVLGPCHALCLLRLASLKQRRRRSTLDASSPYFCQSLARISSLSESRRHSVFFQVHSFFFALAALRYNPARSARRTFNQPHCFALATKTVIR